MLELDTSTDVGTLVVLSLKRHEFEAFYQKTEKWIYNNKKALQQRTRRSDCQKAFRKKWRENEKFVSTQSISSIVFSLLFSFRPKFREKKILHFLFPANFHRFCKTIKINLVTQSSKEESNFWNRECFFFSAHQFDAIARSGIKGFGQTLSVSLSIFRKKKILWKKLSVKNVRIFFSPPVMHFWTFERHFKQKFRDF